MIVFDFCWMLHRTPQRSYTPRSIELWFDRLNRDWEPMFTDEELEWGRQYYRDGEIRSTELLEDSAIVHFRRGKEPLYVIIDWDQGRMTFRISHPDAAPGRGLAVAGMYGLEEFIADEVPAVGDLLEEVPVSNERPIQGEARVSEGPREGRALILRLLARTDGLWMEAAWETTGRAMDWERFAERDLTPWEREQVIGLTARAHRSGFRPGDRVGTYRLLDEDLIGRFLGHELAEWRRRGHIEVDPQLEAWSGGPRNVQPVLNIRAEGRDGRYRFDFSDGPTVVSEELRRRLFKSPGHTHFQPGVGIFRVDPETLDSVHEWRNLLSGDGEGVLPRWLLFTFARDPRVQVRLSAEMASWRRRIEEGEAEGASLVLPDWLRPYQAEGVAWLRRMEEAGCPSLLADEMGLGKTVQVLTFLSVTGALGKAPVLVVCPASVVPVWQAEIRRFFPEVPVQVLSRHQPFDEGQPVLWLSSYTQLRRNKAALDKLEFDYAILDEAQSIKNPDAKVTHACMAIRSRFRIALTGTPLENRPLDLWTLFRFLMPGFLGSRRHFEAGLKSEGALARLRDQVSPFILRRTKLLVAEDLPPKIEIDWSCPLTPTQRKCYEDLVSGAGAELGGSMTQLVQEKRMHLFSLLVRLRQACCDPALLPGQDRAGPRQSGKLQSLLNRLEEAFEGGSKVVVFSQFVQFLNRARQAVKQTFPDVPQFVLTGSTLDRERPVEGFRAVAGPAVFFISLRAGGTGLNLQVADYVFLLDPWWNPAVEAQAVDRVHRLGQQRRVIVYRMITRGTIEDRIERLKKDKGQLFNELLSDLEAPVDIFSHFGSLQELVALEGAETDGSEDSES